MSMTSNWIGQEETLPRELAIKLATEAEKNPTLEALCQVFAIRERTRKQLTLRTLLASLRSEGHKVERGDVARCIRFLAALGIGSLVESDTKQVEGLRDIKYSLFYQMTRITKDRGALVHDDRLDALEGAVFPQCFDGLI